MPAFQFQPLNEFVELDLDLKLFDASNASPDSILYLTQRISKCHLNENENSLFHKSTQLGQYSLQYLQFCCTSLEQQREKMNKASKILSKESKKLDLELLKLSAKTKSLEREKTFNDELQSQLLGVLLSTDEEAVKRFISFNKMSDHEKYDTVKIDSQKELLIEKLSRNSEKTELTSIDESSEISPLTHHTKHFEIQSLFASSVTESSNVAPKISKISKISSPSKLSQMASIIDLSKSNSILVNSIVSSIELASPSLIEKKTIHDVDPMKFDQEKIDNDIQLEKKIESARQAVESLDELIESGMLENIPALSARNQLTDITSNQVESPNEVLDIEES